MFNKYIRHILVYSLICCAFACKKDDNLNLDYFDQQRPPVKGPIDDWIMTNYTTPYNISVRYRWEPFEVPINKVLVPVREEVVVPAMQMVKDVWLAPYVKERGVEFMKRYAPKQFVLVGSAQYESDGSIVLGTAEGGRQIALFVLNDFDKKNLPEVKRMLHTIHHEFAHILHQTILYPREYKQITPGGYTATWYNTSDAQALAMGFITPYSRSSADEDFVEMVSTMLVEGQQGFDALLASTSPAGRATLRQKEAMVIAYFQDTWNIDFRSLQATTQQAIIDATK